MLCSWTSPSTARGSPGKRYRKANEILNKRQIDWLNEDCIKSYDGMVAGINFRLKTNYPDIHVHHHDTHTVLFQFKNSDDVECNPIVCFCLRIFKDMSIRLWNNGVEVHSKYFKSLLSNTKSVLGLWSQFCEVLRYSKDIPEVDSVTKSGHIAREIRRS